MQTLRPKLRSLLDDLNRYLRAEEPRGFAQSGQHDETSLRARLARKRRQVTCLVTLAAGLHAVACADAETGRLDAGDDASADTMDDASSWSDGVDDGTDWDGGEGSADGDDSSASDGDGGDGDGDDGAGQVDWSRASVVPQGHGWSVADGGQDSEEEGPMQLQSGRLGARVISTSQWLASSKLRAKVSTLVQGGTGDLSVELTDPVGVAIEGSHWLELSFHDEPSLAPDSMFISQLTQITLLDGHAAVKLDADALFELRRRDAYWLTLTLGGETLAGSVRGSSMLSAVYAQAVDAGGIRASEGMRLPSQAHEPIIYVRREIRYPGDVLSGLPALGWTCHSTATALGYPRIQKWLLEDEVMPYVGDIPGEYAIADVPVPLYTSAQAEIEQSCAGCIRIVAATEYRYRPELHFGPATESDAYVANSEVHYGALELHATTKLTATSKVPIDVQTICTRGSLP